MVRFQELKVAGPIQWQNDQLTLRRDQVLSDKEGGLKETVDGVTFLFTENSDAKKSIPQRAALVVRDKGGYRALKFVKQSVELTDMVLKTQGKQLPANVVAIGQAAGQCANFLSVPGAVAATASAAEAIGKAMDKNLSTQPKEWQHRKIQDAFESSLDATTMLCAAGMTLSPFVPALAKAFTHLKLTAEVSDGASSLIGATSNVSDWRQALNLSEKATTEEGRNSLIYFARLKLLQLAKAVCSITGFIFAMAALTVGALFVSPIVALAVALAGTVFALWALYYEKSMDHSFKFYDAKHHIAPVVV